MKDERIQTTHNRIAAIGFCIWQFLTLISFNYRFLILKQHPREIWDIIAIFLIVNIFFFFASANKGAIDFGLRWKTVAICIAAGIIGLFTIHFITGRMFSFIDLSVLLFGCLLTMGLFFGIPYFLNRRWKRKEGLEDEK